MTYYSIIDQPILLEKVNHHPIFSYAVTCIKEFTDDYTIYVTNEEDKNVVEQYHSEVQLLKGEKQKGTFLPLNRPLLTVDHLEGNFDRFYDYIVKDHIDLQAIKGLIYSDYCKNRPRVTKKMYIVESSPQKGKPKLLITAPYSFFTKPLKEHLSENYDIVYAYNAPKEKVKELLFDREILFTSTAPGYLVDDDLLTNANNLKVLATPSTGTTHIDVSAVKAKNINIVSIKESPVIEQIYASSEFSFTLLLAMVNKLPMVVNYAKHGNWRELETQMRSQELFGMTIGLLGYGRIGKKMARFSHAMGLRVIAYDPAYLNHKENHVTFYKSKEEVLAEADIVSIHYHLSEENYKSFTKKDFDRMKPGSYFLNTARGELVDEGAMLEALKRKKLLAAALDVIDSEHQIDKWNNPLMQYARNNDNLIIAPHVAGLTIQSESKAALDIFEQLETVL